MPVPPLTPTLKPLNDPGNATKPPATVKVPTLLFPRNTSRARNVPLLTVTRVRNELSLVAANWPPLTRSALSVVTLSSWPRTLRLPPATVAEQSDVGAGDAQ